MADAPTQRKIHVVEVLEATDGGTRTHILQILRGLDRKEFRLTLIASAERNPAFRRDMDALRREGIGVGEIPMVRAPLPWRDAASLVSLVSALRPVKCDVLHTHASKAGALGRVAARLCGIRAVVHTPHVFYFQGKRGISRRFYRAAERALLPLTPKLILLSEGQRKLALEELGADAQRLTVVPNGVDTARFAPHHRREQARAELGLPADAPVFGTIGRFAPQKRCDLFLQAAARVFDQVPASRCVLVGDGPLEAELMRLARRLGIRERILWLPRVEDPTRIYDALDVFALASSYEGMPYTLLEAMSSGVAVVAPRIAGCEEVITDGETGLLATPGDAEDLARAILRLLREPAETRALGLAARRAVVEKYPIEIFRDRLSRLYRQSAGAF